jgi:hypothetical protein
MTRIILIVASVFSTVAPSFSATLTDEERVVATMSNAAQRNDLAAFLHTVDLPRISARSHGECTSESLIAIGKLIGIPGITFETRRRGEFRAVRATTRDNITAFFSLHPVDKTMEEPEGRLVIVAVDIRFPDKTP